MMGKQTFSYIKGLYIKGLKKATMNNNICNVYTSQVSVNKDEIVQMCRVQRLLG